MKTHQLLPLLLVMTLALGNLVLSRIVHDGPLRWPALPCVAGLGLVFAQIVLIASWLVWSSRNVALRIVLSLAMVYLLAHPASTYTMETVSIWFTANLCFLAIVYFVFLIARFAGVTIRMLDSVDLPESRELAKWQFSIGGIVSATTGIACLLGVARHLQFPATAGISTVLLFLTITVVATISFFVAFFLHRMLLAAVAVTLSALLGGLFASLTGLQGPWTVALMNLTCAGAIAGSVAVSRVAGFQLVVATRQPTRPL